jgi:hypothetical protein
MSAISDRIETLGTKPLRVKGDAGEVEQYSIEELIKADRYTRALESASYGHRGLRITKLLPPGTVGDE